MIRDFIAIDFETANQQLHTVAVACGYENKIMNHIKTIRLAGKTIPVNHSIQYSVPR